MPFNRHEILKIHYLEEIRNWDWDDALGMLQINSRDDDVCEIDRDGRTAYLYIGSVLNTTPSGKIYAFWTTNQTRRDEAHDAAWFEALEEVCDEHGCYIGYPDCGDGDSLYVAKWFDNPEEELDDSMDGDHESALASAGWGTDEDYGGGDDRM